MRMLYNSYFKLCNFLEDFKKKEEGQALSEYAIVIGVVAVIIIATLVLFRGALTNLFTRIITYMEGVT
ncbi:Flp family type IVb pilin [Paenibacillus qinlingensis]|uniref:Flp pilus assembly pilin Flp n=1 Tax=Paenibacillus qinlingensis TaxID=1837343 RepID=A0ABU1NVR6_9BACL|nr:Flp family type IVb pilin [Paenibacillus qinlingensis]MDR6551562.1 Flp pilus assembly pilin Flp [Paenibacillus qinlingensis]